MGYNIIGADNQQLSELIWGNRLWFDDFTVSICLDGDYTKTFTFGADDLK